MTGKVNSIPDGFHTVTPYLMVQEAAQLIDFVKQAFGATELMRATGSAGGIHAEVRIGDSVVMIGGVAPGVGKRCQWRSTCTWTMLTQCISVRSRQALTRLRSRRTSPMGIAWRA